MRRMRPRAPEQAGSQARRFLAPKLRGIASATLNRHLQRTDRIARRIFERWGVGIEGWRLKHVRWLLEADTRSYSDLTRYDYWTTVRHLVEALDKTADWLSRLNGPWVRQPRSRPQRDNPRPLREEGIERQRAHGVYSKKAID